MTSPRPTACTSSQSGVPRRQAFRARSRSADPARSIAAGRGRACIGRVASTTAGRRWSSTRAAIAGELGASPTTTGGSSTVRGDPAVLSWRLRQGARRLRHVAAPPRSAPRSTDSVPSRCPDGAPPPRRDGGQAMGPVQRGLRERLSVQARRRDMEACRYQRRQVRHVVRGPGRGASVEHGAMNELHVQRRNGRPTEEATRAAEQPGTVPGVQSVGHRLGYDDTRHRSPRVPESIASASASPVPEAAACRVRSIMRWAAEP